MNPHTAYSTIFTAPLGVILAGLVGDVPRYEREKSEGRYVRTVATKGQSRASPNLQSRIIDVLKHAGQVLDAIGRTKMDANAITGAVDGKKSTVYDALCCLLDDGTIGKFELGKKIIRGRQCIEWVMK